MCTTPGDSISPGDQYDTFACHPLSGEAFKMTSVLTRAITCEAHHKTRYLLKKGCNPNAPAGKNRIRPLMVAAYVNNNLKRMAIFRYLMKHGADPTLRDVHGRNSIMYTCALGLRDETQLMVKDCDYDLNATDMYGDTVLHMCAKAGNAQVLGVVLGEMLKHRMDISVQNHRHLTPLSLALSDGNHECAKMLHQAGGSPRCLNSQLEGFSKSQEMGKFKSGREIRIAWNDPAVSVCQGGGTQVPTSRGRSTDLVQTKPGPSLRRQRNFPKLFTRVRVESASDICMSHSGGRSRPRYLTPRAEPPSRGVSTGKHTDSQARGHYDGPGTQVSQNSNTQRSICHSEEPTRDGDSMVCTHPTTSMDCINAILNSPVYKTRAGSSFSRPSKTISGVDSQWLSTIGPYSACYEEIASLPKLQSFHMSGRQKSSSSSSSASSSQSQLFRAKVLRHMMTSPLLFKAPLSKVLLQEKDECRV